MPISNVRHWIGAFVLLMTGFLAFFFKKYYPEIARSGYVHTAMTVRSIEVASRYCCYLECASNNVDGLVLPPCSSLQDLAESFSPDVCANTGNLSLCPPVGVAVGCDNEPVYSECDSYNICTQYSEHKLCRVECDVCYSVTYTLAFTDRHGRSQNVNFGQNFGYSINDAKAFMAAHPVNSTIMAYYNPSNPGIVILHIPFHPLNWGLLVLFGFPLFVVTAVLTQYMIGKGVGVFWPALVQIDFILNIVLWIGIIWPFIILLPILKEGYVEPSGKKALNVLIPVMAAFGWLPLVLYRLEKMGYSSKAGLILTFSFFMPPFAVVLPCMLVLVHSTTTEICLGVLAGACLLLFANFLFASWQEILAVRTHL